MSSSAPPLLPQTILPERLSRLGLDPIIALNAEAASPRPAEGLTVAKARAEEAVASAEPASAEPASAEPAPDSIPIDAALPASPVKRPRRKKRGEGTAAQDRAPPAVENDGDDIAIALSDSAMAATQEEAAPDDSTGVLEIELAPAAPADRTLRLDQMTVKELRSRAAEQGVSLAGATSKAQILKRLKAA
tara:strand:+ start:2872 stop:3441 length:570 start_codon:yes stop_codon:yes gene_type:complete